ncbi:MAG: ATP-binding protein [Pirellulaceae bacterium]
MIESTQTWDGAVRIDTRANQLYRQQREHVHRWTDRLFAGLLLLQWLVAMVVSVWVSPYTWVGQRSDIHLHVWSAVFLGGMIALLPVFLALRNPGHTLTRHVIAVGQMLFGSLLIDLTGGRIETHFHIFGSLALLAFYRDWRVLITATVVVVLDHFLRGIWWPQYVFGTTNAESWRWLEHSAWIIFIDIFLVAETIRGDREIRALALRQAELELTKKQVEQVVVRRTLELKLKNSELNDALRKLESLIDMQESDHQSMMQKNKELALAKRQAESATQAKSDFLSNMSHEIRTPLTAILGYAELLDENQFDAQARTQTIGTIKQAGHHLLTLVNDILDLSKIEVGKMPLRLVETDLAELMRSAHCLMQPRAVAKGLRFDIVLDSVIPRLVTTDPTRLRQIVLNLLGNAIKFTEQGSVTLRLRISEKQGVTLLEMVFDDTGIGISAEQAEWLFQPFHQAESNVNRRFGGTGLGLTICRRLTNLMGGDTRLIRTEPGQGARFVATIAIEVLPHSTMVTRLEPELPVETSTIRKQPVRLSGKVLLAEDGIENQRLIAFLLRKAGAEVIVADNGAVALQRLDEAEEQGAPFQLLVSDMQMPHVDGYELAKTLRRRKSPLPIIALTAHAMEDDKEKCLDAGCNDYASKPIDRDTLIRLCEKWILPYPALSTS